MRFLDNERLISLPILKAEVQFLLSLITEIEDTYGRRHNYSSNLLQMATDALQERATEVCNNIYLALLKWSSKNDA